MTTNMPFQPIRNKHRTNVLLTRVFPRLVLVASSSDKLTEIVALICQWFVVIDQTVLRCIIIIIIIIIIISLFQSDEV